jgi:hypothetical protein
MSALGHKQTLEQTGEMSALPPIADIRQCGWDVRKVPIADMKCANRAIFVYDPRPLRLP